MSSSARGCANCASDADSPRSRFALESGVSHNQIAAVEWGKSSLVVERLFDLAAALEDDVREFLVEPSSEPARAGYRGGRRRQEPSAKIR